MGKQSRRIRQHTAPVKRPPVPVRQQTSVRRQTLFLDDKNDEDTKILGVIKLNDKYSPLRHEDIRQPPNGKVSIISYLKYKLREVRQDQARYIADITKELVHSYSLMKIGISRPKPLDIYFNNFDGKITLIKFLTHLHNGNGEKASHYYIKWRGFMSNRIDSLLFDDCGDEYIEVNGKRIDADKDEAVRLLGERIQADVEFYKRAWKVLIGTELPVC